jgi:uncharacterized protein (TIRG00374 family)
MGFLAAFRIVVATEVASAVTPTAMGGGYAKLGLLFRDGIPVGQAGFLMVLGTAIDLLLSLMLLPLAVLLGLFRDVPLLWSSVRGIREALPWLLVPLLGGLALRQVALRVSRRAVVWLGMRWPLLERWRVNARRALREFRAAWGMVLRRGKRRLILSLMLAALQWGCRYSIATLLIRGLDLGVHPVSVLVRQWAIFSSLLLVPTPGGSGGAEAMFFALYAPFIPHHLLGMVTVGWRFFTFYLPVIVGGALVLMVFPGEWMGRRGRNTRIGAPLDDPSCVGVP